MAPRTQTYDYDWCRGYVGGECPDCGEGDGDGDEWLPDPEPDDGDDD